MIRRGGRIPNVPGLRLVAVGEGDLRSGTLFGDAVPVAGQLQSDFVQAMVRYHRPAPPPLVLANGVAALDRQPRLHDAYRSYGWVLPLDRGLVRAWAVRDLAARIETVRTELQAEPFGFALRAPTDELRAAADSSRVAGRRLLPARRRGGCAVARLHRARRHAAEAGRRRLARAARRRAACAAGRWRGRSSPSRPRWRVAGTLLGWLVGVGVAVALAGRSGEPVGCAGAPFAALRGWPCRGAAARRGGHARARDRAGGPAALGREGLVLAARCRRARRRGRGRRRPRPRGRRRTGAPRRRAAPASCSCCCRRSSASRRRWRSPASCRPACACWSGRRLAGRFPSASRRWPSRAGPGRWWSRSASWRSRSGSRCSPRPTAGRSCAGSSDQAAFAVPADYVVKEDLSQLIPVDAAVTPAVLASLPRALRVEPVTRQTGSIQGAADVSGIAVLGLSAKALPRIDGWRGDFASASLPELARRIDVGPKPLRGAVLPLAATSLALPIRVLGTEIGVVATIRARDGSFVPVRLGGTLDSRPRRPPRNDPGASARGQARCLPLRAAAEARGAGRRRGGSGDRHRRAWASRCDHTERPGEGDRLRRLDRHDRGRRAWFAETACGSG